MEFEIIADEVRIIVDADTEEEALEIADQDLGQIALSWGRTYTV